MSGGAAAEPLQVRRAGPADADLVLHFIRELARFERLEHEVEADATRLARHLGGPQPACGALLADRGGRAVGFALFYQSYSTFKAAPCLHLEDLFVLPEHRGHGIGLALLRAVAAEATARGCPRLDWHVLDWNEGAIGFYRQQGARLLEDWRICRLDGAALGAAAASAPPVLD